MNQRDIYKLIQRYDQGAWTPSEFAQVLFGRIVEYERELLKPRIDKVEVVLTTNQNPSRVAQAVVAELEKLSKVREPKDIV